MKAGSGRELRSSIQQYTLTNDADGNSILRAENEDEVSKFLDNHLNMLRVGGSVLKGGERAIFPKVIEVPAIIALLRALGFEYHS